MLSTPSLPVLAALASLSTVHAFNIGHQGTTHMKRWLSGSDKIRGVNLGSHLIIEPWMANDEWNSMGCSGMNDEWACVESLGQDAANEAFATHWNTWITQDDISQMVEYGLNTIRVPVGFWIKEDLVNSDEHFPQGGLEYLDKLVGWASDAGLYVIMDLHGGPGGQTADQQFTGHSVSTPGWFTSDNYERTYEWLEWMTNRIHTTNAYRNVGMIEVMNEPAQSYAYPDDAADMIQNFYPNALNRIRAAEDSLGTADGDRLHVEFMSEAWGSGDPTQYLNDTTSTSYDDHRYLKWDTSVTATKDGYISAACADNRGDVIIGEWSIAVADDLESTSDFSTDGNVDWYKDFWAAQAQAFERSQGWVFWSWKCNWIGGINDYRWCYQSAVAAGAIPDDATSASSISPC